MPQLSKLVLEENHKLLRLKAKLQSVKWKGVPEEVTALTENLAELVTPGAIGHGGYFAKCTTVLVGGVEFIRVVLGKVNDVKFIPSVEVFISPDGFAHFHIVLTFVGDIDEEVDAHVANDIVNYICGCFNMPNAEITVVIHRRWKQRVGDKKAPYTEALWGDEDKIQINKALIRAQQTIALKEREELEAAIKHEEQLRIAKETNPRKPQP
jgi:hypothetical protein